MTWANDMLIDQIKAVRQALRTSNKAEVKELLQQLADREKSIALEYESLPCRASSRRRSGQAVQRGAEKHSQGGCCCNEWRGQGHAG